MKVKTLLSAVMLCLAVSVTAQQKSRIIEDGGTGPYKAIMKEVEGLEEHTVFVPQDLSKFSKDHPLPVLVWGNGACSNSPWEHMNFLNEIASHGYLVLATGNIPMVDEWYQGPMSRSEQQIESIDWAYKQNADPESPYYGKIDVRNLCVAGMSCGGLQTLFNCADPRIKALMICNSGLFNSQNAGQAVGGMPMPPKEKLNDIHTPIIYILGGTEDIAYENGMDDFHRISHVPAFAANFPVGHGGTYREPHGGEFTAVALAWLNWQLKGDAEAAKQFVGSTPKLTSRKDWTLERNDMAQGVDAVTGAIAWPAGPGTEFVMQLRVTLGEAYTVGDTPQGCRTVIPITGGTFFGPLLKGTIINGGADYQLADGSRSSLEAIYSIKTDDGVYIHVRNRGIIYQGPDARGQQTFYFKAAPQFEAPKDSKYAWLNNAIYVCSPDFSQGGGITLNVWMVK